MNTSHLCAFAAAVSVAVGVPALAQAQSDEQATMHVKVGDLNAGTATGAKVAIRRIQTAAESFCGSPPLAVELARRALFDSCRKEMMGKAVSALDAPMVTALYGPPSTVRLAANDRR